MTNLRKAASNLDEWITDYLRVLYVCRHDVQRA